MRRLGTYEHIHSARGIGIVKRRRRKEGRRELSQVKS
jgi:hypothetical protein